MSNNANIIVSPTQKSNNNNKPTALPVLPENIPQQLKDMQHWCCWKYTPKNDGWTKTPIKPFTDYGASSTNTKTWSSYITALTFYQKYRSRIDGIGFFLHPEKNGIIGIDVDHVLEEKKLNPELKKMIDLFYSYAEFSPSGEGLRIMVQGKMPSGGCRSDNYEMYGSGRYVTITGQAINNMPIARNQFEIEAYHASHINRDEPKEQREAREKTDIVPVVSLPLENNELLQIALSHSDKAKTLFEDGSKGDHSKDDLCLATQLFCVTDDIHLVNNWFTNSELYREKWDRGDYRSHTLTLACSLAKDKREDVRLYVASSDIFDNAEKYVSYFPNVISEAKEPESQPLVRMVGIQEMIESADNQKEDWLLHGWLEFGSLAMLTGFPFSGKSCIVSELIASMHKHKKFAGVDVKSSPIILIDLENRDNTIVRRLRTTTGEHDLNCLVDRFAKIGVREDFLPLDKIKIETIIKRSMESFDKSKFEKFKPLVIIDTLRSAFSENEMDADEMRKLLYPIQRVAQRQNAAILILHHRPKTGAKYSGQSSIPAALDYLWMWDSDIETRQGKLSLPGTRFEIQDSLHFMLDETGRNVFTGQSKEETTDELTRLITLSITCSDSEVNQSNIILSVQNSWKGEPPSKHKIRQALDDMEGCTIVSRTGARNAKFYSLL